jgi:TP901 family phage tail tape measure protein
VATEVAAAYVELGARIGKLEAGLASASAQVDAFGRKADARSAGASAAFSQMGRAAKIGTLAVAGGLALAVKSAATFDTQMSQVKAVTGATGKQMDALRQSAIRTSASTRGFGYTAKEVAQAQTELGKAGLSVAQIMGGGMAASLTLAKAGSLQLGDAASYTANAMAQFNLSGKQAGMVSDAMATAANVTTADVGDFGMALVQTGAAARSAGLSFNDTMTALTALAKSGVKGSDAGTSLKTSLIQLIKPTAKQAEAAKAAGISFIDQAGDMRSLADISGQLRTRTAQMSNAQRTALFATLAGTDGVRTLLSLYNAGPGTISKYSAQLSKAGTATQMAATMNDNAAGKFKQLMATLQAAGIEIGSALLPPLVAVAQAFAGLISKFTAFKPLAYAAAAAVGVVVAAMAVNKVVAFSGAVMQAARSIGILSAVSTVAGTAGTGVAGVGVAAASAAPRMAMASRAMSSFGAAAGILTGGLKTLGPYSASQAGKMTRLGAAGGQAKMGMMQLAGAIPLVANPIGLLAVAAGVGVAGLLMFGKRTDMAAASSNNLATAARNVTTAFTATNQAVSGQAALNQQVAASSTAVIAAKNGERVAVDAFLAAHARGRAANETEAAFQMRLVNLYKQVTSARLTSTQAQNTSTEAVRASVDNVTKLGEASNKEIDAARRRVETTGAQAAMDQRFAAGSAQSAKSMAANKEAVAALAVAESRRGDRLKQVEKAQVAARNAVKASSMTDSEKAASLDVVNRAIAKTRGEIKSLPESKTTTIKAKNDATATIEGVKRGLSGIDRFITVTIKGIKEGFKFNAGGFVPGFAGGGTVRGPGGVDRVPAMLTAGEVVLTKRQQALVNGGMNIRDAIRSTGGAYAKGGTVGGQVTAARGIENRRKAQLDAATKGGDKDKIKQARTAYNSAKAARERLEKDAASLRGFADRAGTAYVAMGLADFDQKASANLKKIEQTFVGTGDVANKSFAQLDSDLAANLKSIEQNFKGTGAVAGHTFKSLEKEMRAAQKQLNATFDALTPAEAQIKSMQDASTQEGLTGDLGAAQADLAEAQKWGDPKAIAAAQKSMREAERAMALAELSKTAEAERAQQETAREAAQEILDADYEAKRALMQEQLDAELETARGAGANRQALLQQQLDERLAAQQATDAMERVAREHNLQDEANKMAARTNLLRGNIKDVITRMTSFAKRLEVKGKDIGEALSLGLVAAGTVVKTKAAGLAAIIAKYLETKSPTELGPMSNLDEWWSGMVPALFAGLDESALRSGLSDVAALEASLALGGSRTRAGAGAGGAVTINLNVSDQTFAGMSRDQADRVARDIKAALDRQVTFAL